MNTALMSGLLIASGQWELLTGVHRLSLTPLQVNMRNQRILCFQGEVGNMNALLVSPMVIIAWFRAIGASRAVRGVVVAFVLIGVVAAMCLLWRIGGISHAIAGPGESWG